MKKEFEELYESAMELMAKKPKQTLSMGRELIRRGRDEKDYEAVAYGHFLAGNSIFAMGLEKGLMSHATQAAMYFRKTGDPIMQARSLNLQGIAYSTAEEFQLSLMTYLEAYQIASEHKLGKYRKDVMLNNIAACYFSLGDYSRSIRIMEKVYRSADRYLKDNRQFVFNMTCNLADVYCEGREYQKALVYAEKSSELICEESNDIERLLLYIVKTKLYYGLNDIENGNYWSDKVNELLEAGVDTVEAHRDYERIVLMQLDVGEDDRADKLATFMWNEAERTGNTKDLLRATRMQARYFDLQRDTRSALYYYRKMDSLSERRNQELLKNQLKIARNNEILAKQIHEYEHLMKEKEEMEILANRDAMTGLLNRYALSRMLEHYVGFSKKEGIKLGCIFVDVDCFKEYNDTYGHVKGDDCLIQIANACKTVEDDKCFFARYGGDEFFGIAYDMTNEEVKEKALAIMKSIRKSAIEHKASKVCDKVSVSIGILNMTLDEENNLLDVVNFSDRALYHSKENGKNCISMFDEEFFVRENDMAYTIVE